MADCVPSKELLRSKSEGGASAWKRAVAIVGLVGAPVSGGLGTCALLAAYLFETSSLAPALTTAGNAMLIAVIPLLMMGAAVLDLLEADLGARDGRDRTAEGASAPATKTVHGLSVVRRPDGRDPVVPADAQVVRKRGFRPIAAVALVGALGALAPVHAAPQAASDPAPLTDRERMLLDRVERLEQRVAELEAAGAARSVPPAAEPIEPAAAPATLPVPSAQTADAPIAARSRRRPLLHVVMTR
jgi:hypothetical protein